MTNNNNNVHSCLLLCLLCSLLLLLFTATTTRADLPLHCEHKQIKGDWLILMSSANKLAKRPLKCQDLTPLSFVFHQTMAVSLQSPNVVTRFLKESGAAKRSVLGAWTMVYDQGFEFTAENYKFFAYNNFTRHEGSDMITSFCAETNFGWYERTERKTGAVSFGCYYARKMNKKESDTVTDLPVNMKLYENPEEHKELNTHALSDSASMTLSEDSKLFKNDAKLIRLINEKQSLWKAKAYKRFEKLTNGQIKAYNGMAPNVKLNQYLNKMKNKKQQRLAESMSDISVSSLPESWDWRNVSGVNYVSPVRDQGSCGSCYTFATLAAFESRIRILTKNKEQAILAPQDVVSCSAYNQKCSGGFPFLVGKQTNDFSLVTEDCFPYKGDAGVPCSLKCKNPRLRVTVNGDYQYIGGFYGAGNTEELMMREIYTNGPIPVSYQVYSDFKYYENGIYSNVKAEKVRSKDAVNDFEATTHSVAIVGWGVDKETDTKYWIAKNSWGADWGMDGYFLIKKGVDEAAIEAQAVAPGVPVLHYRRHKK